MPDNTLFILDAHLDLSMNALEWNRDMSRPLDEIRGREAGQADKKDRGRGTVSLPEMRRGNIGLCVATQIARYTKRGNPLPGWHSSRHPRVEVRWPWLRSVPSRASCTVLRERGEIFSRSRAPDGGRAVALCRP